MNKYSIIKVLGEGGYGKALLVERKKDKVKFVVKEVRMSNLKKKEKLDAKKEVDVLRALSHPNIVAYIESFEENGRLYIVMEYADGGDLSQKIQKQGRKLFTEEEVLHYFIQISLALKYMHDRKILHRDLKGQNVFLCKDGKVKLGDFGIAKVLDCTAQLCQTQIGTPYYLSPEICEGKRYNSKTDIWSLGCILYELCTLKHPFDAANMNALLACIIRGRYSPISTIYSSELRNLVAKMLTKDPKQRPSINNIIHIPLIRNRLENYLDEALLKYELNHTILHGRKPLQAPTMAFDRPPVQASPPSQNASKNPPMSNDVNNQRKLIPIPETPLQHQQAPQPAVLVPPKNPRRIDYRKDHSPLVIPPKKVLTPEEKAAKEEERKQREAEEARRKKLEAEKKKKKEIRELKAFEAKRRAQLEMEKRRKQVQEAKEKRKREAEEYMRKKREQEQEKLKMDEEARKRRREEMYANVKKNQEADAERRRKMKEEIERKERLRKQNQRNATPDHARPSRIDSAPEKHSAAEQPANRVQDSFYNDNKANLPKWAAGNNNNNNVKAAAGGGSAVSKAPPKKRVVRGARPRSLLEGRPDFDLGISEDDKRDEERDAAPEPEVVVSEKREITPEERRRLWEENMAQKRKNREQCADVVVGVEPECKMEIEYTPSIAKTEISDAERRQIYKENRAASKQNKANVQKDEYDNPAREQQPQPSVLSPSPLIAEQHEYSEDDAVDYDDDFEFESADDAVPNTEDDVDNEVDNEVAEEMEDSAKVACSIQEAINAREEENDSFGDSSSDDDDNGAEQSTAERIEALGLKLEQLEPPDKLARYRALMAQDHADLREIPDVVLYYLQQLAALEASLQ